MKKILDKKRSKVRRLGVGRLKSVELDWGNIKERKKEVEEDAERTESRSHVR